MVEMVKFLIVDVNTNTLKRDDDNKILIYKDYFECINSKSENEIIILSDELTPDIYEEIENY